MNYQSLPQSLKTQLTEYWSGLYSVEEGFLTHEWGRHGTCWNPMYGVLGRVPTPIRSILSAARQRGYQSPADFLSLAVTLLEEVYDFYKIFRLGGIVPSNTQTYLLSDLKKVISSKLGIPSSGFALKCQRGRYLNSVWLCLDKNYQPLGGCQNALRGDCDDQVYYPLDRLGLDLE